MRGSFIEDVAFAHSEGTIVSLYFVSMTLSECCTLVWLEIKIIWVVIGARAQVLIDVCGTRVGNHFYRRLLILIKVLSFLLLLLDGTFQNQDIVWCTS